MRCTAEQQAAARAVLVAAGVAPLMRLTQTDTYFAVQRGRLKLREIAGEAGTTAELIAYARPDARGPRWSAYRLVPMRAEDAAGLKAALAETVGVRAVVGKMREVGIWRRSRVHLDTVAALGTFIELETVLAPGDDEAEAATELAEIAAALGLDRLPAVAGSYVDLVGEESPDGQRATNV